MLHLLCDGEFRPDYSWVPQELKDFVNWVLGICILISILSLLIGVVRFIVCKITASRFDDMAGTRMILAVFVGAFGLGTVAALCQCGFNDWSGIRLSDIPGVGELFG